MGLEVRRTLGPTGRGRGLPSHPQGTALVTWPLALPPALPALFSAAFLRPMSIWGGLETQGRAHAAGWGWAGPLDKGSGCDQYSKRLLTPSTAAI